MKLPAILLAIAGSGLVLLSWSQPWFAVALVSGAGASTELTVGGAVASPALAALSLAGLALAGALAIAGPGIRIVLGILAVVLGGCLVLAVWTTLVDVVDAVAPAVTDATGVAGTGAVDDLVAQADASWWPVAAVAGGVLMAAAGVLVLVTGPRWPAGSRRYGGGSRLGPDAALGEPETRATAPDGSDVAASEPARAPVDRPTGTPEAGPRRASDRAVDDWDELSRGDDPTA